MYDKQQFCCSLAKVAFLDDEDDEEDALTGKANEAFATQDKPTEVAAYSETKESVTSF